MRTCSARKNPPQNYGRCQAIFSALPHQGKGCPGWEMQKAYLPERRLPTRPATWERVSLSFLAAGFFAAGFFAAGFFPGLLDDELEDELVPEEDVPPKRPVRREPMLPAESPPKREPRALPLTPESFDCLPSTLRSRGAAAARMDVTVDFSTPDAFAIEVVFFAWEEPNKCERIFAPSPRSILLAESPAWLVSA